ELAVYDCRIRPVKTDKTGTARVMYFTFDEYAERWDEMAGIFSREAVLQGSFDRYAESTRRKRGTAEVDTAFLAEIERWRETLARNIALRTPGLTVRDLNFAVQRTIDRVIFLRIAEDRGLEPYGQLRNLGGQKDTYRELCLRYLEADNRYNSGLFHFKAEAGRAGIPDELTTTLAIDDKVIQDILRSLYYPDSPYEFSVLPGDILGQVYEQFLGKVIRLTAGGRAKVEHKPEVKKAGGVFYTPTYIVDYIVAQTVGVLLEDKNPRGAAALKICDPACGSGSFLLGAYQVLLDWHRDYYVDDDPEKYARSTGRRIQALYQGQGGEWRLTTAEKRRILLNNIYGVDIDPQAVEVTKLSLLLKVLEGENQGSLGQQLAFFQERALPDLGTNIKCGNSLIGPDFYTQSGQQTSMFNTEEVYRINAFDWEAEFTEIMAAGGFDAVIGNPPYIRIQALKEWAPEEVEFYKQAYVSASKGNYDIYVVFVEKGLQLLNQNGLLGYILPHKFFNAKYGEQLRGLIAEGKHLSSVVHFSDQQVFKGATTYTCLLFLQRRSNKQFHYAQVGNLMEWQISRESVMGYVDSEKVGVREWNFLVGEGARLFEKLVQMPVNLGFIADRIYQGPITSADKVFLFKEYRTSQDGQMLVFSQELQEWITLEEKLLKLVVRSGSIGRYWVTPTAWVLFPYEVENKNARLYSNSEMKNKWPLAWKYLKRNKKLLENREKGKFKDLQWYRFGRTQNLGLWEQTKLLVPYMVTNLSAYYDVDEHFYFINVTTGGYGITIDESKMSYSYLCGLLNSRLMDFYLKLVSTNFRGGYYAANKQYIEQLPIRTIDFSNPADTVRHNTMVTLVETMLDLHKSLAAARTPTEKQMLQRQIETTDQQIDALVYELYGLTEDEIRIVEGEE
ncbi:MAG: Eco57I restriction-modification methylase domain-containing protein, partial [Chloroflexota bacterium]|nr:Eco57I restriction-modification methylase domain-containing protein [Chloroflexota bacterium]